MQDREVRRGFQLQSTLVAVLLGGMIALGVCCLLLLMASILVATGMIPERMMPSICMILCGFCSLMGGRFAVTRGDGPPLLLGVLSGMVMCILILMIGYMGYQQPNMAEGNCWIPLAALIGGAVAGLAQPAKKSKGKKRKKR